MDASHGVPCFFVHVCTGKHNDRPLSELPILEMFLDGNIGNVKRVNIVTS
jgi:hypothetical protein